MRSYTFSYGISAFRRSYSATVSLVSDKLHIAQKAFGRSIKGLGKSFLVIDSKDELIHLNSLKVCGFNRNIVSR